MVGIGGHEGVEGAGLGIGEEGLDIAEQHRPIGLEGQTLQQERDGDDFVRLVADRRLAQHQALPAGPGGDEMQRLAPLGAGVTSYDRKLVTVLSGGVFNLLDTVLERDSFDEFGELV